MHILCRNVLGQMLISLIQVLYTIMNTNTYNYTFTVQWCSIFDIQLCIYNYTCTVPHCPGANAYFLDLGAQYIIYKVVGP
jgi:hypothetical protein